ncbi:hypothetical protein J4223_03730 [Candidatus Woesearchaeota archaeon]|nr:hypothetical protein [Candidatus Woesearchaeota archaeon]
MGIRTYQKVELTDLINPGNPMYIEVTGIVRGCREDHYLGVFGNPQGFYSGLLQSINEPNFFVCIAGMVGIKDDLGYVLRILSASSETNLPVTIRGSSGADPERPGVHHIAEIDFGNLKYKCSDKNLI